MNLPFPASSLWSPSVVVGWAVASLAAFVAIDVLARVNAAPAREALRWRSGAALGLGTGVWSTLMLTLSAPVLDFPLGYQPLGAALSWLLALAAALAGAVLASAPDGRQLGAARRLGGALAFGLGTVAVQLTGAEAMDLRPGLQWRPLPLAGAGLAAALGAAVALAWLSRPASPRVARLRQATAAALWGIGIVLAHQLAVAATNLAAQTSSAAAGRLPSTALTLLASVGALALLLVMLFASRLDARTRASLRRTEDELANLALTDGLTRLPSRLRFEGMLTQAVRQADARGGRLALLFVNVDGFKQVNEGWGHQAGDRVLCEIAERLRRAAKLPHTVARVGGDEFVLLLPEDPDNEQAGQRARAVLQALSQPCRLGDDEVTVTAAIGITMYPEDGALSTVMAHADLAMRAAKATGGSCCCFFERRMVSSAREQAELVRDLRQALGRGELELLYQPKIRAATGEITGAEALLRWNHPSRGLVGPAVFVPLAERHGLIKEIGGWVIDEACRQIGAWREQGLRMRVAINLSPHQLNDIQLGPRIQAALGAHQINPELLTCEITESVALENTPATKRFFEVLAGVGVHISIDDFGTGYSSLASLRLLPAAELKLDRSFVCDLETSAEARTVAEAVVKLGKALHLKVVAEGVETEGQHQILRGLGCDELQGYLFAKPMPARLLALWAMDDVGPRSLHFRASLFRATESAQHL